MPSNCARIKEGILWKYTKKVGVDKMGNKFYGQYLDKLIALENRGLNLMNKVSGEIEEDKGLNPIEHIKHRIKTEDSLKEKLQRQGFEVTLESAKENITDMVGFRIICTFVGGIYEVVEELKKQDHIEFLKEKDYVGRPKPNGYRSYHLIIQFIEGKEAFIPFEVQLRTIAMDSWASLEHQLKYKQEVKHQELIISELKRCADEMASTDLTMQTICEMIYGKK